MNVTVEKKDSLNALLTVEIKPDDYREKVEKVLKDYRKKANIPGFRPGNVPQSLIKKQYGKAVLIEEVNHILQHAVYDHLKDQNLDILGNPLPVPKDDIDWDRQEEFSFEFELGLSPEIKPVFDEKTKVPYYKITADKKMLDKYVEDYARRYGKMSYPEQAEEGSLVKGSFTEVSKDGSTEIENGMQTEVDFNTDRISDKKVLKDILGKKSGESVVLNVKETFEKDFDYKKMLGISEDEMENSTGTFRFDITEINKLTPAPVNQELFDKVFGEGEVSSEDEFRAKIKEDAEKMFVGESDRKFYEDVKSTILEKTKVELPDEFLKKWMQTAGQKPITREEAEQQYPEMKDSMKWQLVENRVVKDHNIEVSQEDLISYTRELISRQMMQYGQTPDEADMDGIVNRVLENKDEVQRITDQLFTEKLINFFKQNLKLDEKEVNFDEFLKKLQN